MKSSVARQKACLLIALASLNSLLAILVHCELEQHYVKVHTRRQGAGPSSRKPLSRGGDDLGT
jgi:hypothetical protein